MGVYIKGMEMPKDCAMMLKVFPDGSVGVPVHLNWCGVLVVKDAEAVPIPPHGRLIDADALHKKVGLPQFYEVNYVTELDIVKAPTVIEAEEGE